MSPTSSPARRGVRWALATWLLANAAFATAAAAQSPDDSQRADQLFVEATKLVERGELEAACAKFESSQRLDAALGTEFNLALCYQRLGRLGSAWSHFRNVERLAHATAKSGREQAARQKLGEIYAHAPRLVFTLTEPDVTLTVDGARVEAADLSLYAVDPGEHAVTATAPARKAWTTTVTVVATDAGTVYPVAVPTLPVAAGKTRVVMLTKETTNARRVAGFATLGVGLAGLVAAGVTGGLILGAKSTADRDCQPRCLDQDGVDAVNRGKALILINYAAWGLGAAGVGVGTFLLLTSKPKASTGARWAPFAGPGSAGLSATSVF